MTKKDDSTDQYLKSVKFLALRPRMNDFGTVKFLNDAADTMHEWALKANNEYDYWSMTYNAGNIREISKSYQALMKDYQRLLNENKILMHDLTCCLRFIKSMDKEKEKETN